VGILKELVGVAKNLISRLVAVEELGTTVANTSKASEEAALDRSSVCIGLFARSFSA